MVSVGRKAPPRRRTSTLHAQAPAPARGRQPRRRKSARPRRNDRRPPRKRLQERFDSLSRPKSALIQRSPSPSSRYAPWDNSSGWDTILRRPVSPPPHQAPNPEGWCPNDKAFVHVTHEVTMLGGRKPLKHPVWIRVKITEVRESVNEVDERVVPKGMLILTCRTQRSRKLELPKEYWRPFDIDARRVVRKVPSELIDTGKRPPYRGKPIPKAESGGPRHQRVVGIEPEPGARARAREEAGFCFKAIGSSLSPSMPLAYLPGGRFISSVRREECTRYEEHARRPKKGLGSMGSSMNPGRCSPPRAVLKRPFRLFGRNHLRPSRRLLRKSRS